MIPPVQGVPPDKFQTNTPTSNQNKTIEKQSSLDTNEWYCKKCDKHFSIPKRKVNNISCPYCGSDTIDILKFKMEERKLWMNI